MKSLIDSKNRLRFGTAALAFATCGVLTPAAAAQEECVIDEATGECADVLYEEVTITGSRIKRRGIDTVEPAIVLDSELIERRSFTNIADLLNETPAFGTPAASPRGTQGGFTVGQNFVNFLDLGSQRTLTLVNGRRFVSGNAPAANSISGGLQVDFNTLPIALVERIETVATAGAPTYGSDAIAGTVNVILKDDFEGLDIRAQYGTATGSSIGENLQVQAVFGGNFADDRGNLAISVEWFEQEGVFGLDRPFFAFNEPFISEVPNVRDVDGDGIPESIFQIFNANGTDGDFDVQIVNGNGIASPTPFLIPSRGVGVGAGDFSDGNFYQFNPSGNLVAFTPGRQIPGTSEFFAQGVEGGDNFFERVDQIQSPLERIVISGIGHYDVTEDIRFFSEFLFANTEAEELSNQGGFQTFAFGGADGAIEFSVDHPLLNQQARDIFTANGLDTFFLSRFNNDILGEAPNTTENFVWRYVAGLEGDFELAGRGFDWQVYFNQGQADVDTAELGITTERFLNAIDAVALTQADIDNTDLDALSVVRNGQTFIIGVDGAAQVGDAICRSVLNTANGTQAPRIGNGIQAESDPFVDGCVPLSLFGENTATPEAIDFVTSLRTTDSDIQQRTFSANLQGELFELPGGIISFGIGYENRKEIATFTPNQGTEIALDRNPAFAPNGGRFSTNEFYGELLVPILKDGQVPFINSFTFEPKFRNVDNSIAGNDITWSLGGAIKAFDMITFRGAYTESIRAPSLVELFTPEVQGFGFVNDPCDFRFVGEGPDPAIRRANCIADGITDPDNFTSNAVNASIIGTSAGNPNLTNETAKSYSLGITFEPKDLIPGLTIVADYVNLELEDRIQLLNQTTLARACYDDPTNFPSPSCDAITRDPTTRQIVTYRSGFANASLSEIQTVLGNVNYNTSVSNILGLFDDSLKDGEYGDVNFRINFTRRIQNDLAVGQEAPINDIGEFQLPKWAATYDINYRYDKLNVFWRIAWQSKAILDAADENANLFENEFGDLITNTGDRFIHNATISYEIFEGIRASATVNNVFNRRGNVVQRAYGDVGFAEVFGRSVNFRISASF